MKIKSTFAVALLVITLACDDDNDNVIHEKTSLLTLTVDASYTDLADQWIIIHGEDGALLASESFELNQELEIVTDKPVPRKITVTHLRYFLSDGTNFYFATTHSNVEKGKHMILKRATGTSPEVTGKIKVSVSNVTSLDHQSVSSQVGGMGSGSWNGGSNILEYESYTYSGITKHIVTISDGYLLKHRLLNDVKPNDSYSFSFDDMDPFDHTVDFTFPQTDDVIFYVSASEPNTNVTWNNYSLIGHYKSDLHTTIKAGYLNSLTNHKTRLNISYPGYGYEYQNIGSIPNGNIAWPQKSDFNISDKSFTNFSVTTLKSYVWRLSRWGYIDAGSQNVISWNVSAPLGSQSIKELPSEITSVHPALSFSNLKHSSTTFYTQSPTYESLVNNKFESGPEPAGLQLGIKIITD